ncbi:MAG: sulfatase [Bacteroidales bacterium]|nr:sulfatase [Bacteroidales bacterium]MCF8406170.1 sulfatase [Bacteroidales bacterium]
MNNKFLLLSLGFTGITSLAMPQQKPNILFFLVDDLGWNDISANGSKLYETPNIDEVLNESVYFTNAYAAYPRCVPSRYAMITGRHPARDGQTDGNKIKHEETTMAEALKAQGYGTFFAGKWHLGHDEEFWPHNHGFDVNKGGCDAGAPGSYFFPYGSDKFTNESFYGLEEGIEGEYITDRLTTETIKYIKANHENPFLAYVAHYAVHTPLQAKKEKIAYYEEKIGKLIFEGEEYSYGPDGRTKLRQDNAIYAAMVESMDESFGAIVKELKDLGIYENTIIIFTSDHGGLSNTGPENKRPLATSNLPLRAGKGHIYEGGIKVPVFVRWPGVADKKATSDMVITGMDYFPSILEMCGFPMLPDAHIDGKSFVPALKGKDCNNDRVFTWHQTAARPESTGDHNSSVIRKGNFKLHYFLDDQRIELYDLTRDPYEKNNISAENPEITEELMQQLQEWKIEAKVSGPKKKQR